MRHTGAVMLTVAMAFVIKVVGCDTLVDNKYNTNYVQWCVCAVN